MNLTPADLARIREANETWSLEGTHYSLDLNFITAARDPTTGWLACAEALAEAQGEVELAQEECRALRGDRERALERLSEAQEENERLRERLRLLFGRPEHAAVAWCDCARCKAVRDLTAFAICEPPSAGEGA